MATQKKVSEVGLHAFEGGATRSRKPERRELIPSAAIDALARRLALGAERHGEGNWKLGGPDFRKATINHLIAHCFDYLENGDEFEANTDAIICNAAFLCWYEKQIPHKPNAKSTVVSGTAASILERQREGIAIAKAAGKYKGRRRSLNPVQIHELRVRAAGGERKTVLAREFGVCRETIYCYLRAH
jgi:hypothetical protein